MVSLDVGCGYEPHYKRRGDIGIDLMRGKCDVCADAHFLPFRTMVFDQVFLMNILEHLVNPKQCIEEVKRVCKRNARIQITIPQITNMPKWKLRKAITDFPFGILEALKWLNLYRTHPHKELGHKTIVTHQWVANHLEIISVQKEGWHSWFSGRKGNLLRKLGLKDKTKLEIWRILAHTS
jgi:SAM-dependent methyltransferase